MPTKLDDMRGAAKKLLADARKIRDDADSEGRELSGEERNKIASILSDFDQKRADIDMEERFSAAGSSDGSGSANGERERGQRLPEAHDDPEASDEEREAVGIAGTNEYRDAFYSYLRSGEDGISREQRDRLQEVRALTEGTDSQGGYLAPPQLAAGVEREALDMEQIAPRANTINANVRAIRQVTGEDSISFTWVAEGENKPVEQPSFDQVQIDAHTAAVMVRISDELLEDTQFDLEGYISTLAAEAKVEGEEAAYIAGTGNGQPYGILTSLEEEPGTPQRYVTQPASAEELITGDDFVRALYALAPRYRRQATWVLGTQAIVQARLLKANDRQYIWQPGLQAGQPDSILGKPVIEAMHDALDNPVASGNNCGLVGDLRRYTILRRLNLQVKRLEELYAQTDEIALRFRFRVGGRVQLNRAFRSIQVGTYTAPA